MTLNRGLAFLISMIMLVGMLPVRTLAGDPAGGSDTMGGGGGDTRSDGQD